MGYKKKRDRKSTEVQLRVQDSSPTPAAEMDTEALRTSGALPGRSHTLQMGFMNRSIGENKRSALTGEKEWEERKDQRIRDYDSSTCYEKQVCGVQEMVQWLLLF